MTLKIDNSTAIGFYTCIVRVTDDNKVPMTSENKIKIMIVEAIVEEPEEQHAVTKEAPAYILVESIDTFGELKIQFSQEMNLI